MRRFRRRGAPRPLVLPLLAALALVATACAGRPAATRPPASAPPRYEIAYRIALPDPASHLFEVELTVGGVRGDTLRLQMPVWSPGRYARFDFARNVQEFAAVDEAGRRLAWDKETGSLWRVVPGAARQVTVRYRVFANQLSGTQSVLDTAHANWNGPSIFMYVDGQKATPVRLRVSAPAGWRVVNGASEAMDQREFSFPTYDHLVDTPTEVAPGLLVDSVRVDGRTYRVVVHHRGEARARAAQLLRAVERIVRTQHAVLGPPPLERYTFLVHAGFGGSDGMEHLTSTQVIVPGPWTDSASVMEAIGTASHEYFHVWNVKRIRPAALGPFDYTREQFQPSLWVAEGWTQYYGDMTLLRAGLTGRDETLRTLAAMIAYNSEMPGRREVSARMSSFHAPFWDGAPAPMPTNRNRTWLSYYYKGEALALLLDLELRARTRNARSLDDVLRLLKARTWDAPATSYYLQGRGYTEADVERAVSNIAGADFAPWFERYVAGTEELPWTETLALAGLRLVVRETDGRREYALQEIEDATPAQLRVRHGWLEGTNGALGDQ